MTNFKPKRVTSAVLLVAALMSFARGPLHGQNLNGQNRRLGVVPAASVAEQYLESAADQERAAEGLPPLRRDAALVAAARAHALLMVSNRTISHQFPGEPELAARAGAAGARFSRVTENVAEGPTPMEIESAWMHSPGHRRNLLDRDVDAVGIAVVASGGELYAVEDFERTVARLSLSEQEGQVAALLNPYGVQVLADHADARATCATESGYQGARRPFFVMRFTAAELNRLPQALESKLAAGQLHHAAVGACPDASEGAFSSYRIAVMLFP